MSPTQSGYAEVNGAKLYYEVIGRGQPLVFIHAGVADSRLWDDQAAAFADRYQVVRYDLRGFGRSEPVDGEFSHREDFIALMEHLKITDAVLVGCSMGGGTAMDIAFLRPTLVTALVMVCSGPRGLELDIVESPLEKEAEAAHHAKDWERLLELQTQIWFDGRGRKPTDVDPAKRAKALAMNRLALSHAAKGLGSFRQVESTNAPERLGELTIPVLVIIGALDEDYTLKAGDYMAARIPNVTKVVIENTAHLPSLERPDEFNRALAAFLASLP
jgi:pimeloyl-ACP methyl ester carboxylesterase